MTKKLARVLGFGVLCVAIYLAAVAVAARVNIDEFSLLQHLTGSRLEPGGRSQSLRRFRDAEARGHVDIVFFGSSHAYSGFDPRLFAALGYTSMNLGSMNQTPLNTYELAGRYLPKLTPRLVVLEIFYPTIGGDGLESCRDLTINTPFSWSTMRMAVATWNIGAMTFAVAKGLGLAADDAKATQREIPGEVYVSDGHCQALTRRRALVISDERVPLEINPEQLRYLERTTARVRETGARIVWVTHPLPVDYKRVATGRAEVEAALEAAARRVSVDYWNYDATLALDPLEDFADLHHLSASGVAKFDGAFITQLTRAGYLVPPP